MESHKNSKKSRNLKFLKFSFSSNFKRATWLRFWQSDKNIEKGGNEISIKIQKSQNLKFVNFSLLWRYKYIFPLIWRKHKVREREREGSRGPADSDGGGHIVNSSHEIVGQYVPPVHPVHVGRPSTKIHTYLHMIHPPMRVDSGMGSPAGCSSVGTPATYTRATFA